MLIFCDNVYDLNKGEYEFFYSLMPSYRKKKISRYAKYEDRVLGVTSYALLKYVMHLMGIPEGDIEMGPYGKPYFKGNPVYFNISHTSNAIACAVEPSEVGVDIQNNIREYERIAKRVCTPSEIEKIRSDALPIQYFTKLWTLKESYVKCIGTGIWDHISQIDFSTFDTDLGELHGYYFTCKRTEDYCLSVCSKNGKAAIQKIGVEDILKQITEKQF